MRYIQMNNLHRWSKSRNTLTIRYGQILITVSSSPIGPDPVWNTAVVPCRQAGILSIKKVVGSHELTEAEFLMPQCSDYVQTVFKNTKTGNGQKWLMLDVRDREIMDDVFRLINLRKRIPS